MQKSDLLSQLLPVARAKILRQFVIADTELFSLIELAKRAGVSTRAALQEVKLLVKLGIVREVRGQGKTARERAKSTTWSFEPNFKHASALSTFVHDVAPTQFNDVEKVFRGLGRLTTIVLSGVFVGDVRRPVDVIVVGDFVNEKRLEKAVRSLESKYGREIRYALFSTPEFRYRLTIHDRLIRSTLDYPHRVLLNKNNLI